MHIDRLYPSTYLKAADLDGRPRRVVITHMRVEKIGNGTDEKPVLYFQHEEKGLVLNKTNATTISMSFGPDTDNWEGGEIELFPAYVDFQGQQKEAIRVRMPKPQPRQQQPQQPPQRQAGGSGGGASFAPNARDRARAATADQPAGDGRFDNVPLDDEVPF